MCGKGINPALKKAVLMNEPGARYYSITKIICLPPTPYYSNELYALQKDRILRSRHCIMACNMLSTNREIMSINLLTNTRLTKQIIKSRAQLLQTDTSDRSRPTTLPNTF